MPRPDLPATLPATQSAVHEAFFTPDPSCRPTPLYWWSGADLDRDRLAAQLDQLAAKGIGGTVVGYSHLPEGDLDHGDPAPLSDEWWALFRWFTEQSAHRGMTVGIQDYGINGPILRTAGERTTKLHGGTLVPAVRRHTGPGTFAEPLDGRSIVTVVARDDAGTVLPLEFTVADGAATYSVPAGPWEVTLVLKREGSIGSYPSMFDPLHPESGALVIELLYQPFRDHLGDHFGTTFTTIFQDELDFGLRMPLWNDLVADRLHEVHGFDHRSWLPALWQELGPRTLAFRAAYRDVVVELLEDHYFRPIFQWHRQYGTAMYMDQVARGDLRAGRHAYGDYMQTMRWYDGPGNDDPDLTTPRSIGAFKVSASLARLNNRPVVASEAFHSSGWGIAPETILGGLNAGFAYGVSHVLMHALSYTTEGGWWEWASPDFHFRQPWWRHSDALWNYVTRISSLLRYGTGVADVAVLDPTQDLDLTGESATSPEAAVQVLSTLAQAGHDSDLIDRLHLTGATIEDNRLVTGNCSYRALIVPDLRAMRTDVLEAVRRFGQQGGIVIVLGEPPATTDSGPVPESVWDSAAAVRVATAAELPAVLSSRWEPDFDAQGSGLVATHRRSGTTDLYFIANVTEGRVQASVDVRARGHVETFDAWTGTAVPAPSHPAPGKVCSTRIAVDLAPGLATVIVVDNARAPEPVPAYSPSETAAEIHGPWNLEVVPTIDNSFGDVEYGAEPVTVESWHLETGPTSTGPWTRTLVRDGAKFLALGPVPADRADEVEDLVLRTDPEAGGSPGADPALRWRPYSFSYQTGVDDDPLLLDRMTGPHGLKYVPDEFLDPRVLDADPPAGSVYYFWSTVDVTEAATTVSAGSRSPFRLWVDDVPVLEQPEEVPPLRTPAWGLRDLSVVTRSTRLELPEGRRRVLLRLVVGEDQPTRASVALGTGLPGKSPRPRLRWWFGEHPCLPFDPSPDQGSESIWVRVPTPPGFQAAELTSVGSVVSAQLASGQQLQITSGESGRTVVSASSGGTVPWSDVLVLELHSTVSGYRGAAVLTGPVRWTLGPGIAPTARFADHGLQDFSGLVRYRAELRWRPDGGTVLLDLPGLESSAGVTVNGQEVGRLLTANQALDVTTALHDGMNTFEIEVANTLLNRFSVLPSPFVKMQQPGGGFTALRLRTKAVPPPR